MTIQVIGAHFSHKGKVRANQEDWAGAQGDVFVVCDGMGGHEGGEVASRACVDAILTGPRDPVAAFRAAQQAVRDSASALNLPDAGTTCVALIGDRILHVGDSRVYLLRAGQLTQLTRDHTVAQDLIDSGRYTFDEVRNHRVWHILTHCVGYMDCDPDVIPLDLQEGDRLLLCTDGLSDEVEAGDIAAVLSGDEEPLWMAQKLVALAMEGEAPDNITALVVQARSVN